MAAAAAAWSIADLEPEIAALRADIGILGHLINSRDPIENGEFHHVEDRLIKAVETIDQLWRRAWDTNVAQKEAHKAELAAIRAERAASRSKADMENV